MAFRTFAVMKTQVAATNQPLVGSWVTAGFGAGASKIPLTLTLGTECNAGNDAEQLFVPGDYALLINPDGTNAEEVFIDQVSGNTLRLAYLNQKDGATEKSHTNGVIGTGTWIMPKVLCNNLFIQFEDAGTGPWLYIGNVWNFTSAYHRIVKLGVVASGIQPFFYAATENFFGAPFTLSELWCQDATAGDLYNVSVNIV